MCARRRDRERFRRTGSDSNRKGTHDEEVHVDRNRSRRRMRDRGARHRGYLGDCAREHRRTDGQRPGVRRQDADDVEGKLAQRPDVVQVRLGALRRQRQRLCADRRRDVGVVRRDVFRPGSHPRGVGHGEQLRRIRRACELEAHRGDQPRDEARELDAARPSSASRSSVSSSSPSRVPIPAARSAGTGISGNAVTLARSPARRSRVRTGRTTRLRPPTSLPGSASR